MAEASIDQLRISIETKADNARSAVRGLADDVKELKTGTRGVGTSLSKVADGIGKLSSARVDSKNIAAVADAVRQLQGIKISSTVAKNVSAIASAASQMNSSAQVRETVNSVRSLSGLKLSSSIANQIRKIAASVAEMNQVSFDATKFHSLYTSLAELSALPRSNLGTTVNALKRLPELAASLDKMDMTSFRAACDAINDSLGKLPEKFASVASGFRTIKSASKSFGASTASGTKQAESSLDSFISKLRTSASVIRAVATVASTLYKVGQGIAYCVDQSNRYIENINLADTSLGQYAATAHEYADAVQAALGINSGEFLKNQGTFMTMAQGMGVAANNAYTMSKGLTQLSYDLASFFNISNDEAFEKVRSGLAGEIEPLRALGYDLTTARLQQEAYNMGLNEQVSKMTQAEKAMLRYKAIMSQVSWAHGDLAKTAASPANQIRILKSQMQTAAQAIGNVFLPMLQAIIPVAVAVVKAVATLANLLAKVTGGTAIANMGFGDGGAYEGTAAAADDAADAIGNAGNAAGGAGNKAGKAAKQVEELKRQLMGFDEINKFNETSSGSGTGGSGGGGGGAGGGGAPNISDIKLDDYDWALGDGLTDKLYDEIMDMLNRIGKAFQPLVDDFKVLAKAIQHQFDGLDIVGSVKNEIAGVANLISNTVRQIIEIIGPLIVAFNFPETIALSFDLAAQMCLTLSAAINGVGTMIKGFTDTALIQLVAWIGDKLRGAIYLCIDVLQSWQDWFMRNVDALGKLGQAAGIGATLVLHLAEAVADVAFTTAAVAFQAINTVLQVMLELLVNSEAARVAATLLGAALTALAVTNGIAKGLQGIGNAFAAMAKIVSGKSAESSDKVKLLSTDLKSNLKTGAESAKEGLGKLASALGISKDKTNLAAKATEHAKTVTADAADALANERTKLNEARSALGENATYAEKLGVKTQAMRVKTAESNLALEQSKDKLNSAKLAAMQYASSQDKSAATAGKLAAAELKAGAEVAANTAKLGASTVATGAMTVAETAMTVAKTAGAVAQGLLNAAIAAFPGMVFVAALSGILSLLQPIIDGIGSAILGFLGLSDATGEATDSTKEANETLSEEEQQVKSNVDSIKEYEKSHDNLADALAMAGFSEQEFAQHLADTGQTFDDVAQQIDSFSQKTINSFDAIETGSSMSLETVNSNLANNLAVQQQWSDNLIQLCSITGWSMNSSMVQALRDAGPEKMATALQEVIDNPTSAQSKEFIRQLEDAANSGTDSFANILGAGSTKSNEAGKKNAKGATDGVKSEKENTKSEAKKTSEETAQEFASAKKQAKTSGKTMVDNFANGINSGAANVKSKAEGVRDKAVTGFNGGTGYTKAKSAGKNMSGGYGDGISAGAESAASAARGVSSRVVSAFRSSTGTAHSAGTAVMNSYRSGLSNAAGGAVSAASSASNRAANAFRNGSGTASSSGRALGNSFANGLRGVNASSAAHSVAASGEYGLRDYRGWYENAGRYVGYGFDDGLWSTRWTIYNTAEAIATNAANRMRRKLRIHSPSRVTMEIGGYFGEGFAIGISDSAKSVSNAVAEMTAESLDATQEAAKFGKNVGKAYGNAIGDGFDASKVASMLQDSENLARSTSASTFDGSSSRYTSHEGYSTTFETETAVSAMTKAMVQSAMTTGQLGGQQVNGGGDTTIVLRVGNEDLARAVVKGNESLARRGVVSLE
ncbi:hypothetical protein [Collinsella aerofaciens]|uniref:hypothetical protein n=1 Tax=Collinsella aerofaciens TaxID=74426 RepID=UPI003D7A8F35